MPTPIRGQIAGYNASFTSDASDWVAGRNGNYLGGMGLVADTAHGGTKAYLLDQIDDHIEIQDDDAFSFPGEFSVACWAKFGSTTGGQTLVSKYSVGESIGEWYLLLSAGRLYAGLFGPSNYPSRRRTAPFSSTEWSHIAMTYDGSSVKIYVNGARVDDADANDGTFTAMANTTETVRIGYRGGSSDHFGGRMDDIRIGNVEWTSAELTDLASSRVYEPPVIGPAASQTNLTLSATTSRQRGMLTASKVDLSSQTDRQHGHWTIAKCELGGDTTHTTVGNTAKQTNTRLIVRNARGRRTETIRLAWDSAADVPAIYRSWIAIQIKMARPNYEPAVSATGADSGRMVPVTLRGFDSQVLKILMQPYKPNVDPEDVILEITDYA